MKTCFIVIRVAAARAVGCEVGLRATLDEIAVRLRREAAHGRDGGPQTFIPPSVIVEMAAFYREHPDHN